MDHKEHKNHKTANRLTPQSMPAVRTAGGLLHHCSGCGPSCTRDLAQKVDLLEPELLRSANLPNGRICMILHTILRRVLDVRSLCEARWSCTICTVLQASWLDSFCCRSWIQHASTHRWHCESFWKTHVVPLVVYWVYWCSFCVSHFHAACHKVWGTAGRGCRPLGFGKLDHR